MKVMLFLGLFLGLFYVSIGLYKLTIKKEMFSWQEFLNLTFRSSGCMHGKGVHNIIEGVVLILATFCMVHDFCRPGASMVISKLTIRLGIALFFMLEPASLIDGL